MDRWCKIIETQDTQVLFYIEPEARNDDEDCECLHQIVRILGVCADIKVGGIPLENAEKYFDDLNEESANLVVKVVTDLLENQK